MLTQIELKELLHYDPIRGTFTWLKSPSATGRVEIGREAGYLHKKGYIRIGIWKHQYWAHRLAFLYMTGEWPKGEVDHKNKLKDDNRWDNLRRATRSQNASNQRVYKKHTRRFKGVSPCNGRFKAVIGYGGKTYHIGMFKTEEAAARAYDVEAIKAHGEFASLNFPVPKE